MRWQWSFALVAAIVMQTHGHASAEGPTGSEVVGQLDGEPVVTGAVVEVPPRAIRRLVLTAGGAQITLHPGATVVLSSPQWSPPERGSKTVHGSRIFLRNGEISVRMPNDPAKPSAVSVALGGGQQSLVLWRGVARVIARDGEMSVAVDDGAAFVSSQDQWLRMSSGSAALLPKKAPPQPYNKRLTAPVMSSCGSAAGGGNSDLGIAFSAEKRPVRVCWSAALGAGGYRVEVATDEAMTQLVESLDVTSTTTTLLAAEPRLSQGSYWVRVIARSADAFPTPSSPRAINVVRATLPFGAFVAKDGIVVMSPQSALTVDTSAGMTFTIGGGSDQGSALAGALAGTLIASPTNNVLTFKFEGYRARVLRLHAPNGAEALLPVIAREVRARVTMKPTHPRWPQDPIDVDVVLEDTSKRMPHEIDVTTEPITLEARVDGNPVPVSWTRAGDTFRGRIAPVDGDGPFFVHVVAKDRVGKEIGSYIIDIDGRRPLDVRGGH